MDAGASSLSVTSNDMLNAKINRRKVQQDKELMANRLNRLRQEALNLRARHARLTSTQEDVHGVRLHLVRLRKLLGLVRRREKLKAQIAGLHQAYLEAQVKIQKQLGGGPLLLLEPRSLPLSLSSDFFLSPFGPIGKPSSDGKGSKAGEV